MLNNKKRRWELLFSICFLALTVVQAQKRPPNYSQDDMPITSFSCHNRIVGGYYADPETDCQMFHVCVNVPGVGIQDFRFLCPNDTTFDQEHQICDDWYNIDCELAQYDSFDLYRIGVDNEIKKPSIPKKPVIANKGTPIPLGPSSTVKPLNVVAPKKNIYTSVNNGISDDEDYYSKHGNAVSDESKVPNDILRGSHSSNFYDSKTKGREDYENDYVAPNTGVKKQELSQPSDGKKHKTLVRKLASKRPVQNHNNQQNYNNVNYNPAQNTQRAQNNQSEFANNANQQQKNRGNVNYNTYTKSQQQDFQDFQRIPATGGPNLYQKINNLTEENNYQEKKQDANRNYESTNNFRSQSKFRPSSKFTTAVPITTAEVRLPSTEYLQNIANNFQQPATLINNQLQDSGEYRKPTEYQGYNNQAYDYTYQQFKQPTSNQAPTAKYQTVSSQKYYETSTAFPDQRKSTEFQSFYYQPNTTVFDYLKYYQTSTTSYQQKAKNYYSTTTTTTSTPKYDPYATFQKSNEKYDEDEFLKTAPSSNLKPSDLNTIYNQKKNAYINATLKAAYNIEPHKASYYQAIATSSQAPRVNYNPTTTPATKNYYQTPTTTQNIYQPAVSSAQQNYQQSAASPQQPNNYYQTFSTAAPQKNYYQSSATNAPQNTYFSPAATNAPQFYQSVATSTPQPQNNFYRQDAVNTQQTNFYQSPATNVPQNNFYPSVATNPPQNVNYQAATNTPQNNNFQTVTTKLPQKPNYQPAAANPTKPASGKQTSFTAAPTSKTSLANNQTKKPGNEKADYDYAYYDNGGGSAEYDTIDAVGEDFARIKKTKQ
ncbi:probable serine/threonine-protein kinase clkA [Planococcus citri]|uniref:probable serine/threonine-protein kinase clkA n=1 Tax=Planococcus citri TaxID=170843 RepID=UPI0031F7D636